eukprot:scaffold742_cov395-Prasinococcus_capsulatus_cf.AAC.13
MPGGCAPRAETRREDGRVRTARTLVFLRVFMVRLDRRAVRPKAPVLSETARRPTGRSSRHSGAPRGAETGPVSRGGSQLSCLGRWASGRRRACPAVSRVTTHWMPRPGSRPPGFHWPCRILGCFGSG